MRYIILLLLLTSCTQVDSYFCPDDNCHEAIIHELENAEEEILFATYSFTHPAIAAAVIKKQKEGVHVQGVIDQSYYSKLDHFQFQNIDVIQDTKQGLMHHKFWVIDNKIVITGSMNPTKNGAERNRDNIVIVKDNAIASRYRENFQKIIIRE